MSNDFKVLTTAIIYNNEHRFLLTKRSMKEKHMPGVYSYPGGKIEYTEDEFNILEKNLKREIKEETNVNVSNIQYLSSHTFEKEDGTKICAVSFLAKYESGEVKSNQPEEIEEVFWADMEEIDQLLTLDAVKQVYHQGKAKLESLDALHHVSVAGIILNEDKEYMLVRTAENPEQFTFPQGAVKSMPGTTWEMLEKNLSLYVYENTGIELADGLIPFTDEAFVGYDGFDSIIQFFIGKRKFGKEQIKSPEEILEVKWVEFKDFNQDDFDPLVYRVFDKANNFIAKLSDL